MKVACTYSLISCFPNLHGSINYTRGHVYLAEIYFPRNAVNCAVAQAACTCSVGVNCRDRQPQQLSGTLNSTGLTNQNKFNGAKITGKMSEHSITMYLLQSNILRTLWLAALKDLASHDFFLLAMSSYFLLAMSSCHFTARYFMQTEIRCQYYVK